MSNFSDKRCLNSSILDRTIHLNTTKPSALLSDKNTRLESTLLLNKTNSSEMSGILPRQPGVMSQVNQLFKVPNFENLPVKKATVKSIKSPKRRVQTGRVKNDLKSSQGSKVSLIPRPSFINSRKSLHGSRSNQLNARKELIKKMVFLAECTLKENKEIKQSTPVKVLAGLTPKKTPKSGGYFILPEFNKKIPKLEEIRSPLQDLIKKEMYSYSTNPTPVIEKINKISPVKLNKYENYSLTEQSKEVTPRKYSLKTFTEILHHCKTYNKEVHSIHEKLKLLDESFQQNLQNLPDYKVYNEFCFYQTKKEDIYKELQTLEKDLRTYVSAHTKIGCKMEAYVKKKREYLQKQIDVHKDFEQIIESVIEKCGGNEKNDAKVEEESKTKVETPKLRRSLRLSKIKKNKFEERTPMTKKLKKLDNKSKGIQKKGRSP